jgi:beta-glucanase (GH16 family)
MNMTFSDPAFAALTWSIANRGNKLDLTGYKQAFRDDFNSLSVSGSNGIGTRWFSPARDNYGGAVFKEYVAPPLQPVRQISTAGQLAIRMEKVGDVYQSAHIQTTNRSGVGFTQSMGYFEASMKFQKGAGVWPAFWLLSVNEPRIEVDVVEAYGGNDYDGHHTTLHLARTYHMKHYTALGTAKDAAGMPLFNSVHNDMFDGRFHTYGSLLTNEWIIIYYDGIELCRFPMTDYFRVLLYMCVSLAMFDAEKPQFVSPKDLAVDYVRTMVPV